MNLTQLRNIHIPEKLNEVRGDSEAASLVA